MKRIVLAAAGALIVAALAYAGIVTHQKRELRAQVAELAAAAGAQFEEALAVDIGAPPSGAAERLDAGVARAEAALGRLRALAAAREPALSEAADAYLAGLLEVQRRQAGASRHRARFIEERAALEAHLAIVGARSEGWFAEAIRLRKRLDDSNYEYQRTAASLANMLAGMREARGRLAAQLPALPLPPDAAVTQARERALAAAQSAKQEVEQVRQRISPG